MLEINIALLTLGGLVILLGLFSSLIKGRFFISDPIIALLVGILISSWGLDLVHLERWGKPETILEQSARLAIAIQVMGVALRLPKGYIFKHWQPQAILLGLVMPLMWLVSGLLVYLILGLPFWVSMLIGAIITPTDPVIATSVVTGTIAEQNLPARIRYTLSAESAANDGLGYAFVVLPILLLTKPPGEAIFHWLTTTLIWEVGVAVILGGVLGYLAGKLLLWSEAKKMLEKHSFLAYTVALSIFVLAAVKLLGSDGILAVFVSGVMFSIVVNGRERAQEEQVQEAIDRFFTLYIFVILGLNLPWQQWLELGWSGLFLVGAILLLRRLPAVLALKNKISSIIKWTDALFMGWFGPIGVAAVFYANLSVQRVGIESIWVVSSLIVCASILIHGLTAVPFTKFYGKTNEPIIFDE